MWNPLGSEAIPQGELRAFVSLWQESYDLRF